MLKGLALRTTRYQQMKSPYWYWLVTMERAVVTFLRIIIVKWNRLVIYWFEIHYFPQFDLSKLLFSIVKKRDLPILRVWLLILICYYRLISQNPDGGYGGGPGQVSIFLTKKASFFFFLIRKFQLSFITFHSQNAYDLPLSFYYANLRALASMCAKHCNQTLFWFGWTFIVYLFLDYSSCSLILSLLFSFATSCNHLCCC